MSEATLWRVKHPYCIEVRTHRGGPLVGLVEWHGGMHYATHHPSGRSVAAASRLAAVEWVEAAHAGHVGLGVAL